MAHKTIDERLNDAQVAIDNALSQPDIAAALAEYLYDAERLNVGKGLLVSAQTLHQTQKDEYGDQYTATDTFQAAWDETDTVYDKHIKIARVVFKKDRGARQSLGLAGRRKATFAGWVEQTLRFYGNLERNQSYRDALAEFGLTQAKLDEAQAKVQNVLALNTAQEDEKGEAQQATVARDEAMEALDDWMEDFEEIAFVALEDQPQLLESLGFGAV